MWNKAKAVFLLPVVFLLVSCTENSGSDVEYACNDVTESSSSLDAGAVALVSTPGSLIAATPRNGGSIDVNSAAPALAVWNMDDEGLNAKSVSYDFEIYSDSGLTDLVAKVSSVLQNQSGPATSWTISDCMPEALVTAIPYYWRVRAVVGEVPLPWSTANTFSVINFCAIDGEPYAGKVLELNYVRSCDDLLHTDPAEALGPVDGVVGGTIDDPVYSGIVSLDYGGALTVEMDGTVIDGDGPDIRIYEFVSSEPLEVFAGSTEIGPWVSLGVQWCGYSCDFDLALAGIKYTRFIQVRDVYSLAGICHATSGPDIDAIEALNIATDTLQCQTI